jgi:hypothetical protein
MDLNRFILNYAKNIVWRLGVGDRYELIRDLEQDGHVALAKCPKHYVEAQKKVAIRYSIMQALVRWRWQVTYHGKRYVPRDEPMIFNDFSRRGTDVNNPETLTFIAEFIDKFGNLPPKEIKQMMREEYGKSKMFFRKGER